MPTQARTTSRPTWCATQRSSAYVLWATGYRPDYSWLPAGAVGADGWPIHRRGVSPLAGLAVLGLPWQHTRGSALVGWVGRDASWLAERIR